ncbi:MAG: hypothetical protein PVI57_14930 [Gemmatimonadota bacterium]|jgi:hypothetical protein
MILRTLGAVIAGLVAAAVTVAVLTVVAVWIFFGGDWSAPPTGPYLSVNLAYTFAGGFLGGWLAGLVAGRRALLHGLGLAVIMLVLSLAGGQPDAGSGIPTWYGRAVGLVGAAGAVAGAWLRERQLSRASRVANPSGREDEPRA